MRRSALLLATLAPLVLATQAAADPAQAILKNAARTDSNHILLGDLFDNAGAHAADEVAASPAPGASVTFNAAWLAQTAVAHGVYWQAPSPLSTIQVTRAATEIGSAEVATHIAAAIGLRGPEQVVALDNSLRLYAPSSAPPTIGVEHLALDRETSRFTAEIRVPADDPSAATTRVSGRIQTMVELMVPTRNLMPGDVITRGDIAATWIRAELAPNSGISTTTALVGRTPRRPLRADQPLRSGDVEIPVVVKRNDLVLMVLQAPGMSLTAQGKSLEDGGVGSVIRVTNLQSNRIIDAVITGAGQVAVQMGGAQPVSY